MAARIAVSWLCNQLHGRSGNFVGMRAAPNVDGSKKRFAHSRIEASGFTAWGAQGANQTLRI